MASSPSLLSINLSSNLHLPSKGTTYLIKGLFDFYHYVCDGHDDRGWGCGYRTLQLICSWILYNSENKNLPEVPSIIDIQKTLVQIEDKPKTMINSREWIGSFEVSIVIDHLYNIPCKILHVSSGKLLKDHIETLCCHFRDFNSPVMMGGDVDCSSKGIAGVHVDGESVALLVIDPHFVGKPKSMKDLEENGWIEWRPLDSFTDSSFYNICLPQTKLNIK